MNLKSVRLLTAIVCLVAAGACEKKAPTAPATTSASSAETASVTDVKLGITLTAPVAVSPANNQQIRFSDQPIKLVVTSAVSTGSNSLTYTFEVANDAAFTSIAATKSGTAAGDQQTATLDKLGGAKTYFWRARASSSGLSGPNSAPRSFQIGPEVVLQAPVLAFPSQNGTLNGSPRLTVNNVGRSGPVGQVSYRFEVADSSSFGHVVYSGTAAEQGGSQTTIQLGASALTSGNTYYWRVQASDSPSGVSSDTSAVSAFKYVAFDMRDATIVDSPRDLGFWAETAKITRVDFSDGYVVVDFDRRDGPNRWPDSPWGRPGDSVEYCLGMCLNINDHWYCSAPIQFWFGRDLEAGGRADQVGINWFYPPAWGPMSGHQPDWGETVGIFVAVGSTRHNVDGTDSIIHERSNVLLLPFGTNFSADAAATVAGVHRR
jgi:hypothetical protein